VESNPDRGFFNENLSNAIEEFQLLYCVMQSDEYFIKNIWDSELYEIELITEEFFDIFYEMRPTNLIKTNYRYSKLLKTTETTVINFLKRHKELYKKYIKINPNTGDEYLEF